MNNKLFFCHSPSVGHPSLVQLFINGDPNPVQLIILVIINQYKYFSTSNLPHLSSFSGNVLHVEFAAHLHFATNFEELFLLH